MDRQTLDNRTVDSGNSRNIHLFMRSLVWSVCRNMVIFATSGFAHHRHSCSYDFMHQEAIARSSVAQDGCPAELSKQNEW